MPCPDPLLVHAYCDGELDAASAVALEQHLAGCTACQAVRADIESLRAALNTTASYHRLEPAQRAALLRSLPSRTSSDTRPRRSFFAGTLTGLATAAGAFTIALFLQWGTPDRVVNDVVSAHVRALMSERLIDVVSSDRHTVKPWFAGRVDVSPPVSDFAAQGYPLAGGRIDYIDGRRAATTVYRHGAHVISVFAWPGHDSAIPGRVVSHNGYQVACWAAGSVDLCAVSDTAARELLPLTRLLQAVPNSDLRE